MIENLDVVKVILFGSYVSGKPSKDHDLVELLEIAVVKDPLIETYRTDLRMLNPFSVQFRYPGESAAKERKQIDKSPSTVHGGEIQSKYK